MYITRGSDHDGKREILGFRALGPSVRGWPRIFPGTGKRAARHLEIAVPGGLPGMVGPCGSSLSSATGSTGSRTRTATTRQGGATGLKRDAFWPQGQLQGGGKKKAACPFLLCGNLEGTLFLPGASCVENLPLNRAVERLEAGTLFYPHHQETGRDLM